MLRIRGDLTSQCLCSVGWTGVRGSGIRISGAWHLFVEGVADEESVRDTECEGGTEGREGEGG